MTVDIPDCPRITKVLEGTNHKNLQSAVRILLIEQVVARGAVVAFTIEAEDRTKDQFSNPER